MKMIRRAFLLGATGGFALVSAATPARAQANPPAPPAQGSASTTAPNNPAGPAAPGEKKVWTNDDLEKLHGRPDIGEFEGPKAGKTGKARPSPYYYNAGAANAGLYRQQLETLRAQLASVDNQISQYRDALDGKQVSTATFGKYYMKGTDWDAELKTLEKRRGGIQKRISDLDDQARRNNIPPGDIC